MQKFTTAKEIREFLKTPKGRNLYKKDTQTIGSPVGRRIFFVRTRAGNLQVKLSDGRWHNVEPEDTIYSV
jgi:hypothetical protein